MQVNWNGFPVEIPGVIDMHNHVHPVGVFLKSHEDTIACKDTLCSISLAVEAACGVDMRWGYFMNDRAWAFLHSNMQLLEDVYGEALDGETFEDRQTSCWAHFMRAVRAACERLLDDAGHTSDLLADLRTVHDVTWKAVGEVRMPCNCTLCNNSVQQQFCRMLGVLFI